MRSFTKKFKVVFPVKSNTGHKVGKESFQDTWQSSFSFSGLTMLGYLFVFLERHCIFQPFVTWKHIEFRKYFLFHDYLTVIPLKKSWCINDIALFARRNVDIFLELPFERVQISVWAENKKTFLWLREISVNVY